MPTNYDNIMLDIKNDITADDLHRHPDDRSIKFNKMKEIFDLIDRKFHNAFPWMYMFLSYKNNGKRVLFHSLRSIPLIRVANSAVNSNSIMLSANWTGDNTDDFFKVNKKKEIVDKKEETIEEAWGKVGYKKNYKKKYPKYNQTELYTFSDGKPPERYISQLRMAINNVSSVYVYNEGFEVQTDSPIDLVCIKRKNILDFKSKDSLSTNSNNLLQSLNQLNSKLDASYELEQGIVNDILSQECLTLPSEIVHIKMLRAYWQKEDQDKRCKEIDSWLLGEYGNTEPEINVGQEANENIIF